MKMAGKGRHSRKRTVVTEPADVGLQTEEEIAFTASLPGSDGAIKVHGDGGARIVLDIPENQLPAALHMVKMRHMAFDVVVRPRLGSFPVDVDSRSDHERQKDDGPRGSLGIGEGAP